MNTIEASKAIFWPVSGEGREARLKHVDRFLAERSKLDKFARDLLGNIQDKQSRCRLVTLSNDDMRPEAVFIYNDRLTDKFEHLGLKAALEIQVFAPFPEARSEDFFRVYAPEMWREIQTLSADRRPHSFIVTLHKVEQTAAQFFKAQGFQSFTVHPDRPFLLLGRSAASPKRRLEDRDDRRTDEKKMRELPPQGVKRGREEERIDHSAKRYQPERPVSATLRKVFIHQIRSQQKTIEGRIDNGMFKNLREGKRIRFFYMADQTDDVVCRIERIVRYQTFADMIRNEGYRPCIPTARSAEDAISQYAAIPGYSEKEREHGVLAIHLKVES
jgi:ASC-1-like (ASCH) protein